MKHFTLCALRRLPGIIGLMSLAFVLSACSANRIGYNNAPTLVYYWLDSYFDFDTPQRQAFQSSLQEVHDWHRREELPLLAELLKNLQPVAMQDVSAEQVCTLWEYLQQRLQAPINQLAPALVTLGGTLKPAQLEHIDAEFKKRNAQWREEWLDLSAADRIKRRSKQIVERTEQFYGSLDATQRERIRQQTAASGYDADMLHREMLRRQQDSLQTLARLRSGQIPPERAQAETLALFSRALVSPDPAARQYTEAITRASCAGVAAVHNSSSPAQRARLVKTLQAYESDARALMQSP